MTIKTLDDRGRLLLGSEYAHKLVLVDELDDGTLTVTVAEAIPETEVWLYRNRPAYEAVMRGIEEAKAGATAQAPDLAADAALLGFDLGDD